MQLPTQKGAVFTTKKESLGRGLGMEQKQQPQAAKDLYGTCCAMSPLSIKVRHVLSLSPSDYYCFAYESSQGYFELLMPKADCEVIDTDSTVECLAQYLLQEQKKRTPDGICQVIAYEGVGKGATVKG